MPLSDIIRRLERIEATSGEHERPLCVIFLEDGETTEAALLREYPRGAPIAHWLAISWQSAGEGSAV